MDRTNLKFGQCYNSPAKGEILMYLHELNFTDRTGRNAKAFHVVKTKRKIFYFDESDKNVIAGTMGMTFTDDFTLSDYDGPELETLRNKYADILKLREESIKEDKPLIVFKRGQLYKSNSSGCILMYIGVDVLKIDPVFVPIIDNKRYATMEGNPKKIHLFMRTAQAVLSPFEGYMSKEIESITTEMLKLIETELELESRSELEFIGTEPEIEPEEKTEPEPETKLLELITGQCYSPKNDENLILMFIKNIETDESLFYKVKGEEYSAYNKKDKKKNKNLIVGSYGFSTNLVLRVLRPVEVKGFRVWYFKLKCKIMAYLSKA